MTWLPLSSAQRGVYFGQQSNPDNPAYTTAEIVEVPAHLDADRLARAVEQTYLEHDFLRMRFAHRDAGPVQEVQARPFAALQVVDLREGGTAAGQAWVDACLARPLDLTAGEVTRTALLRVADDESWWFHAAHHVVTDGFGYIQLARRVAEHYRGSARSREVTGAAEVIAEDAADAPDLTSWLARLEAMAASGDADVAVAPAPRAIRRTYPIAVDVQDRLLGAAKRHGVGWPDLLTAAIGSCLAAQQPDHAGVRIGVPTMNRMFPGLGSRASARTVCTAVNVLPLPIELGTSTVAELVARVREEIADLSSTLQPREEVLARELRRLGGGRLHAAQVNVLPLDPVVDFGEARGRIRNVTAGPVDGMSWCVRGLPGRGRGVVLEVDAHPAIHDAELVELQAGRMLAWLAAFADADDHVLVAELGVLPPAERERVVTGFNTTHHPVRERTLAMAFAEQVARTPEASALVCEDVTWTYRELDARARCLAAKIPPGDGVVGVAVPRSLEMFAAIYAVMLRGAAYVPLDVDLPPARLAAMVADAGVRTVLCAPSETATLPGGLRLIAVDEPPAGPPADIAEVGLDAPAYVLFTSGSTGRPKGVVVSHRAIDNRLAWMQDAYPLAVGDVVLHKTPLSFDVSVWELFWPLQVGATICIAEPGGHRDPRYLGALMAKAGVDTVHFVPSMLRAYLADPVAVAAVPTGQVRRLVCSGEALTPDLVQAAYDAFGAWPSNLYGPTEAAVDVTSWECGPGRVNDAVPIGRPIWNTRTYVLDARGRPAPIGIAGELHLAGVQLALGYVGRDDLTAAAFVPDPFWPGERMYRTGDRAMWRPDGALIYLGRMDGQVKVRGQRLELGEVDHVLLEAKGIAAAATLALPDARGDLELVAFYVAEIDQDPNPRRAAADLLPAYMVPQEFVRLAQLPLSTSGKIDRRRLAELRPDAPDTLDVLPFGLIEQEVARAMGEALGGNLGRDDDFFLAGGHSLLGLRVVTSLADAFGVELRFADLFAYPTPSRLAERLTLLRAGAAVESDDLSPLLTLRPGEPGSVPLFALPPAGGLGWCYSGLLRHLPLEQPLHVLQGEGMDGSAVPLPGSLLDMARAQLALIRGIVGDGPFHLVGWSIGGMAAHAVAALAQSAGQRVGVVVMLDAYPSEQWRHLATPDESEALRAVVRMAGAEHRVPADGTVTHALALEVLRSEGSALAALGEDVIAMSIRTVLNGASLVRSATHPRYDGDVLFVRAGAPRAEDWLDPAAWAPHVGGRIRVHALDASHPDLVREPHIGAVGRLITDEIGAWV